MASSRSLAQVESKGNLLVERKAHQKDLSFLKRRSSENEKTLDTNALFSKDDLSWNTLIITYAKQGKVQQALSMYDERRKDFPLEIGSYTFLVLLKACCMLKDVKRGDEMHVEIARRGYLGLDTYLDAALIDLYMKCGSFAKAHDVLDKSPVRNSVMWTSLISGYVEYGLGEEALYCFEKMKLDRISLDSVTFVCVLKACGSIGCLMKLKEIHANVIIHGLEENVAIGSTLINIYATCGLLIEAQAVFDRIPIQDMIMWTALISGYTDCGYGVKALDCFKKMQGHGVSPGPVTFLCVLKSCASIGSIIEGQEIHNEIVKIGVERELFIGSSLVDMYAKCCFLEEAQDVFDSISSPNRNIITWTALITGYTEHGRNEQAIECFENLQKEGTASPNATTFVSILKACGNVGVIKKGQEIHAEVERKGLVENDVFIASILVDMYVKCGSLPKAQEVFDNISNRNVILWTALMAGYADHGYGEEAIDCFEKMQKEGFCPSATSYVCCLKACGSIGAILKGYELHSEIVMKCLESELIVGNTLVDMYIKCGSLCEAATYVFEKLPLRDVITWTALITGYAQRGESQNVFNLFDKMIGDGIKPNLVTFSGLLNVCSHAGLTEKGQIYLELIGDDYDLVPTLEHYTCIVDLLGRAGHIDKAISLIRKMPFHPGIAIWHVILGACRTWGNVELGRCAFENAIRLDAKDPTAYICMSNIYMKAAMQEDAREVEALRIASHAWIKQGQSWWRDGHGILHLFPDSGNMVSPNKKNSIPYEDEEYSRKQTWSQEKEIMSSDLMLDSESRLSCTHAEKLAVAYALINSPKGMSIHVTKNLPMCRDCHSAIAHTSKMEQRRIVVEDAISIHIFEGGNCECGDCV